MKKLIVRIMANVYFAAFEQAFISAMIVFVGSIAYRDGIVDYHSLKHAIIGGCIFGLRKAFDVWKDNNKNIASEIPQVTKEQIKTIVEEHFDKINTSAKPVDLNKINATNPPTNP